MAATGFASRACVFLHAHGLKPRRQAHGVTVGAAGRHNLAACDRIPGCLGPFNVGTTGHEIQASDAQPASRIARAFTLGEGLALTKHKRYMVCPFVLVSATLLSSTTGKIVRKRLRMNFSNFSVSAFGLHPVWMTRS